VTVLFADVVHSMDIAAAVGAERLRDIMVGLADRCAAVVQRYGGTVGGFTGDGVMAVFGAPVALEDHALRACLAAFGVQEEAKQLAVEVEGRDGVELRLRVGLNSGQVIAGEIGSGPFGYTAVGEQVGIAQRMESVAPAGGVMLSESTARLVESAAALGDTELVRIKGKDTPVGARRLLGMGDGHRAVGRAESNLVGRQWEMAGVEALLDRAIDGHGAVVGVVGLPGIGKSRLVREVTATAACRGVEVFATFCESHTSQVPFHAVARLLRASFGVDGLDGQTARDRVRDRVPDADPEDVLLLDDLLGIADPNIPLPAIDPDARRRRLTELLNAASLARNAPTVYVVEDAHWIDEVSESMLADFVTVVPQTPSLVLVTYRPEYQGVLSRVAGAHTVALAPLSDSETAALVSELLGRDPSVSALGQTVAERAAGNPFFAEEIVRDLAERGVLRGERGEYVSSTSDINEVGVPATLQATIAARIDRLPAPTKAVLNAAAVIGMDFDMDTLHDLQPANVSTRLTELVSAELIDQTAFVRRQRYCFRHPLVRTVAYESQLSTARVHAHRRLAAAIEAHDPSSADENAALIATHLEAAGELVDAYRWHMRAAEWLRPRDFPAARARWESARRIADELPDDHDDVIAMRTAPRTMLISTMLFVGCDAGIDERYREFRDLTTQTGDLTSLALATAGLVFSFAVNENRVPAAAALASGLEDMANQVDCDAETRSIILNAVAFVRFANCEFDAALKVIDALHALSTDVPADELISANALLGVIETCIGRHEQGRRRLRDELEHARALQSPRYALILVYVVVTTALGVDQADETVDHVREALRRAESFGDISGIIIAQLAFGTVLLHAEDAALNEGIDVLHKAHANMRKHKALTFALPAVVADLAIDAARHGRIDEAIDDLRAMFAFHTTGGSRILIGCAGEALVGLLIERGSNDDLTEAHGIVDYWQDRRPGIPALDLWWLKSRALLAKSEDDFGGYAELAKQYLSVCERLDARGRLAEARQMVNRIV